MKNKLVGISKKPFVKNVIIMASGTAAAQIIIMALSPVITRLYGPEAFGLLGVFTAVIAISSPIAALTYPIAIVLPKSDYHAKKIIQLSLYTSIIIALLVTIILLFFNQTIVQIFNIESISSYLYFIPLVILFSGFLQVSENWLIRKKQFKVTAKVNVLQTIILQGSIVVIGFFYPIASILIIMTVFGQLLKAMMMILLINNSKTELKSNKEINVEPISFKGIAKKYKDFPLYRAPEVSINAISTGLPIIMLSSFFGPTAAGFYSLSRSVLSAPSTLIGKSVGDVFYPRISEAANNGENLTKLIKKATLALAIVGIVPYGIVIIFGPWLFGFVFGAEWTQAGEYSRWLALWLFFAFMNRPSVKALPVLSAQGFHLSFTIFMLVTRTIVLALGFYLFSSDLVAIVFFGITGAILNILLILFTLKKSKEFDRNYSDQTITM